MEYVLTIILTLALPGMDDRKITMSVPTTDKKECMYIEKSLGVSLFAPGLFANIESSCTLTITNNENLGTKL